MKKFNSNHQSGFTLLEIIVAMAISGVIGISALVLLDKATTASSRIEENGNRFNQIERTLLFLSNDIMQIAPRGFRDEFGDKKSNLKSDDSIGQTYVSFTRLGRRNPAGLPRSNLEKLTYLVENENLNRVSYAYPDGMIAEHGLSRTLLDKVESLSLEFYDGEEWGDIWPVDKGLESETGSNDLPVAIKISLQLLDIGLVERLFIISDRKEEKDKKKRSEGKS